MDIINNFGIEKKNKTYLYDNFDETMISDFRKLKGRFYKKTNHWIFPFSKGKDVSVMKEDNSIGVQTEEEQDNSIGVQTEEEQEDNSIGVQTEEEQDNSIGVQTEEEQEDNSIGVQTDKEEQEDNSIGVQTEEEQEDNSIGVQTDKEEQEDNSIGVQTEEEQDNSIGVQTEEEQEDNSIVSQNSSVGLSTGVLVDNTSGIYSSLDSSCPTTNSVCSQTETIVRDYVYMFKPPTVFYNQIADYM
jgi:hypothetical protein